MLCLPAEARVRGSVVVTNILLLYLMHYDDSVLRPGLKVKSNQPSTVKVFGAHPSHSWLVDPGRTTMIPQ